MNDLEIKRLAVRVMEVHECHTAILYGSRARGDATADSDVDLLCARDGGTAVRDARLMNGMYLDAFIYPESALMDLEPSLLRVLGGIIVKERDGFGSALLARLREMHERGPALLPDDERQALVVWSQKMLDRIQDRHDVEARYRRMHLLVRALEDYFSLRTVWFRGEKEAFAWLRHHDAPTHVLFERAAHPGADDTAFADLVQAVYGMQSDPERRFG